MENENLNQENNENVINMEEKLQELKEKAKEELKGAQFLEYAIDEKDANIINELKNKLENMEKELANNKEKNMETIEKFNKENKLILDFFTRNIATITDVELSNLIKDNIEKLKVNIETNTNMISNYEHKQKVIHDAIEVLSYKINDENKAYVSDEVIKLARLIMTN